MTDLQLAVLLSNFEKRFAAAIEAASEALMPDAVERFPESHYTGKCIYPSLDRGNWEIRRTGAPVAFAELLELRQDLENKIELLLQQPSSSEGS